MKDCCEDKASELVALKDRQSRVLKTVLVINATMFLIEMTSGYVNHSTALMADSLDMFGDALVYGFSLYVLHRSDRWKARAALLKGLLIVAFGLGVLVQVAVKIFSGDVPVASAMGIFGALALAANLTSLFLLTKYKDNDLNMRSTWICSRNDIIANTGVLVSAAIVGWTESKWPDIAIGFVIAILFFRSAWGILAESIRILRVKSTVGSC